MMLYIIVIVCHGADDAMCVCKIAENRSQAVTSHREKQGSGAHSYDMPYHLAVDNVNDIRPINSSNTDDSLPIISSGQDLYLVSASPS